MRHASAGILAFALLIAAISVPVRGDVGREGLGAIEGVARYANEHRHEALSAQLRDVATGRIAATAAIDPAGRFAFSRVDPATYIVEVINGGGQIIAASGTVAVAAGRTAAVTITPPAADAAKAAAGAGNRSTVVTVAGAAAAVGITAMVVTKDKKIVICHKPAGQSAQTIQISESARDAHLAHGDSLGACPLSPSR